MQVVPALRCSMLILRLCDGVMAESIQWEQWFTLRTCISQRCLAFSPTADERQRQLEIRVGSKPYSAVYRAAKLRREVDRLGLLKAPRNLPFTSGGVSGQKASIVSKPRSICVQIFFSLLSYHS